MCGIAGLWNLNGQPLDVGLLRRMSDSLAHRGPDGADGLLVDTRGPTATTLLAWPSEAATDGIDPGHDLGLGHRRLAIIDLSTGAQPMGTADGSTWVVFNGEIYNYRELREELVARGHTFRTESDTEVILQAYLAFGLDCVTHFNGIFAFALWDSTRRRLMLARDHFGVKPLYYCLAGNRLRFASELKAILLDPTVPRAVDPDALNMCLTFRHTPSPLTLFKGIFKLPPASHAVVDADGIRISRYWESSEPVLADADPDELIEALGERLQRAVRRQMVSDVPLSLSLSGGIDSSALLAIMADTSPQPVHTFTVGFAGRQDANEIGPATATARHFGARPSSQVVTSDDYAAFMKRYIWHLEEPIGNDSAPAYYFVARLAQASGIKVMLNGQGADESFAGYARHRGIALAERLAPLSTSALHPALQRLAALSLPGGEGPQRLLSALAQTSETDQFLSIYTFVSTQNRARLLNPDARKLIDPDGPRAYVAAQLARAPRGTRLERMLWVDARTSLPDNLLLCEDKMSMAASVEARVPFLDLEFMALAERIPGRFKLRGGQGKWIHRRACARFVPPDVVRRPKIGFDNALDVWLRAHLGEELRQLVTAPTSLTRTFLSPETVEQLMAEHASGRHDHRRVLFLLLSLETWHSVFLEDARP